VICLSSLSQGAPITGVRRWPRLKQFQTTPESQKAIDDLALAFKVRVALVDLKHDIDVFASGGFW